MRSKNRAPGRITALALLGLALAGCARDSNAPEFKYEEIIHPVEVKKLVDDGPGVGALMDVGTGKPLPPPPKTAPSPWSPPLPRADVGNMPDYNGDLGETGGERATNWVGTYDIYWKLNWMRKELLEGNVPRNLREVIARTRKHNEKMPKDGNYDEADKALKHFDKGLDALQDKHIMEAGGAECRSILWAGSEESTRQYLISVGLLPEPQAGDTRLSNAGEKDNSLQSLSVLPGGGSNANLSPQQRQARDLILYYVLRLHHSPEEVAREEFHQGLIATLKLRDQLYLQHDSHNAPGESVWMPFGSIHEEAGSVFNSNMRIETPAAPDVAPGSLSPLELSPDRMIR